MAEPLVLVVLDGFGIGKAYEGNAVYLANKPNFDCLWKTYPHTTLLASGGAIGLPDGQIGGSEVGHMHIGSGRIIPQDLVRINISIKDKSFYKNRCLKGEILRSIKRGGSLHLMGLLSDGGVHSYIDHLFSLLELSKKLGQKRIYVHAFLDGRDVPPKSALRYIHALSAKMQELGAGQIATISGRYYAMDRDNRWGRIQKAYDAIANGKGPVAKSAEEGLHAAYAKGETDEFVSPTVIEGTPRVEDKDSVIFFNFRSDRARELTHAFVECNFSQFERKPLDIGFTTMARYGPKINAPVAFAPVKRGNTLAEIISREGLRQLRIAETEKYAHVTYFFNAGRNGHFPKEERILIPSPQVPTYDKKPEMSAGKITTTVCPEINKEKYAFTLINFANPDMVGHTGNLDAAVKAIEYVDKCLGKVVRASEKSGASLIVTADHGNAEKMIENGKPHTAHTLNPVPFVLCKNNFALRNDGTLANIAPTVSEIMNLKKPKEFLPSLIK